MLGRACLHQLSRDAFSLCCPFAIRPCRRGDFPHTPATIRPLGHGRNVCTWICSVGGKERGPASAGGLPREESSQEASSPAAAGPGAAPRLNSGWQMVQHLPGLHEDSQASRELTETFIIRWAQEGGFFSPEPGFPSSRWFADPACNVPQREIHHCYCAHSLVAYNTIIPMQVFFFLRGSN